ncbi:uncharacterized protein LOC121738250 [Aricia agestis]|uniref:uncharacterized protein LOC121738250 n=1 Tax=Aricia agestis TaxID=91739 RepID=UPI001C2031D8|nr:uncharacterized protein LOC121738250 [Aricia agestis]
MSTIAQLLKPDKFEVEPGTPDAELKYEHWKTTFSNYLSEGMGKETFSEETKLRLLLNNLSYNVYIHVREAKDYVSAIELLDKLYIKEKNKVHARYILLRSVQKPDESISDFLRTLQQRAQSCCFKAVDAQTHKSEYIRDAFIAGINSNEIRQQLLQSLDINLDQAVNKALSIELANNNSKDYKITSMDFNNIERTTTTFHQKKCFFLRWPCPPTHKMPRIKCHMHQLQQEGPLCQGAISAASPMSLKKTTIVLSINNHRADALIDSGSSTSFIDENLVQELKLKRIPWNENVTLASKNNTSCVKGMCFVDLKMNEHFYRRKPLYILNSLCSDIIIGHDILSDHSSVELTFGGTKKPLKICNVIAASVPEVSLFANLSENVKPIAIKSRKHSEADKIFIENEIEKLLKDGVIESTNSPWRAQVLVTTDVEEVELIEANPQYSYVRLADGREATISNKHLAPLPQTPITVLEPQLETETRPLSSNGNAEVDEVRMEADSSHQNTEDFDSDSPRQDEEVLQEAPSSHPGISSEETITGNEERDRTRRSGRQRKTPDYLKHYVPR